MIVLNCHIREIIITLQAQQIQAGASIFVLIVTTDMSASDFVKKNAFVINW